MIGVGFLLQLSHRPGKWDFHPHVITENANLYLHEFDRYFSKLDVKLVRYADDFLIIAKSRDRIAAALSEVQQLLSEMGLELHPQKTQVTHFDRGFRFLGHAFLENAIFPAESSEEKVKSASKNRNGKSEPSKNAQKKRSSIAQRVRRTIATL